MTRMKTQQMKLTAKILNSQPLENWKGQRLRALQAMSSRIHRWPAGTIVTIDRVKDGDRPGTLLLDVSHGGQTISCCNPLCFETINAALEPLSLGQLMSLLPSEGERIVCDYEHVSFPVVRSSSGEFRCFAFSGSSNSRVKNLDRDRPDPDFKGTTPKAAVIAMLQWLKEEGIITY